MMRVHDVMHDYATDYLTVRIIDGKEAVSFLTFFAKIP